MKTGTTRQFAALAAAAAINGLLFASLAYLFHTPVQARAQAEIQTRMLASGAAPSGVRHRS